MSMLRTWADGARDCHGQRPGRTETAWLGRRQRASTAAPPTATPAGRLAAFATAARTFVAPLARQGVGPDEALGSTLRIGLTTLGAGALSGLGFGRAG